MTDQPTRTIAERLRIRSHGELDYIAARELDRLTEALKAANMAQITAHQLTHIARKARDNEPTNPDARARSFFGLLVATLSPSEADRVADAMGFAHLKANPEHMVDNLRGAGL